VEPGDETGGRREPFDSRQRVEVHERLAPSTTDDGER
jgi:hypothetical protein